MIMMIDSGELRKRVLCMFLESLLGYFVNKCEHDISKGFKIVQDNYEKAIFNVRDAMKNYATAMKLVYCAIRLFNVDLYFDSSY
jgi:predicted transcriptional regulator YheO